LRASLTPLDSSQAILGKIAELEAALNASNAAISALQDSNAASNASISALQDSNAALQDSNAALQDANASSNAAISALQDSNAALQMSATTAARVWGPPFFKNVAAQVLLFCCGNQPKKQEFQYTPFFNMSKRNVSGLHLIVWKLGHENRTQLGIEFDNVIRTRNKAIHFASVDELIDAVQIAVSLLEDYPLLETQMPASMTFAMKIITNFHLFQQAFPSKLRTPRKAGMRCGAAGKRHQREEKSSGSEIP
jgi:hypothetical protein